MKYVLEELSERGRFHELEPIGVIDIGSNSVRLVVYEGAVRSPTPLFNEKILCGLGRSVASTGKLGAEATERALAALTRFRSIARILDVKYLRAIATAAVRDAADGPEFMRRGEQAAGVRIEILPGEAEAEMAARGILMGFTEPDGIAGDLGGGSLELIDIAAGRLTQATTMPLGGLRLIDTTGDKLDKAVALADQHIDNVSWLTQGKGRTFYAVGGTWRALAKLHMAATSYPLRVMHGYRIAPREAVAFCELVRRTKKLATLPGGADISKARREVLPYGALVLERLLRRLEPSDVVFSVFGIREGLVHSLLTPHERAKDPLISFCEDFARLRSRSLEHARELVAWTAPLFQDNGGGNGNGGPGGKDANGGREGLKETPQEARLRHAACLISDIGWRAHPDYRGEQSLNVIAHAALGGIDHQARIFLALSVYFRHAGTGEAGDELSERLKAAVGRRVLRRARIVGAAVRTAHMLSIGMPGIIDETPIALEGRKLVLTLPKAHAALDGERLRSRLKGLAELLEAEPEVRAA